MRCPNCLDDYRDGFATCATCRIPLVPDEVALAGLTSDARLGTFHPVMADHVAAVLARRGIGYRSVVHDDGIELWVDPAWRDDLRAELTLTWTELVRRLDAEVVGEVLASGGPAPGWFDPPRGGHVDRAGRLVVDVEDEDADTDAARVVGPAVVTAGVIAVAIGWLLLSSDVLVLTGIGLALVGLFTPR